MMKFQSFALPSKSNSSSSKSKPSINFGDDSSSKTQSHDNREFISEFDAKQTPKSPPKKTNVIPPMKNEWTAEKKMKNHELPLLNSGNKPLEFELEDPNVVKSNDPGASMSFGLNFRKSDDVAGSSEGNGGSSIDTLMIRQFKNDLETLPEEQRFDEYDDVPVEGFGAALLSGYGWKEGNRIGKRAGENVEILELKLRNGKEGLGFMDAGKPTTKPLQR